MSLNQLVTTFTRRGIADPTQIAEHISFLLLAHATDRPWRDIADWPTLRDGMETELQAPVPEPPPPSAWEDNVPHDLLAAMQDLFDSLNGQSLGDFYHREARFQLLSTDRPGEYYPTPHHIADFMARLILGPDSSGTVYDPTCGSAGLLVAAKRCAPVIEPLGSDYNRRWASLGVTNLYLNRVEQPRIEARSAASFRSDHTEDRYDYVLMNPPFASGVVEGLITLAQDCLTYKGRAALLVPSGVVQRGSESLLSDKHLVGVVSLPPQAMQPYNGIRAHVLVINKSNPRRDVWLVAPQTDGYGAGRGRPLDEPEPPQPSELPRTLTLVQALDDDKGWDLAWEQGEQSILTRALTVAGRHPGGIALQARGPWESLSWQIVHWSGGALVWLGDGAPSAADMRLLVDYEAGASKLTDEAGQECAWDNISEASLTTGTEWQITDSSPKARVELANDELAIEKHGLTYSSKAAAGGIGACLLDEDGRRISQWYWRNSSEELPEKLTEQGEVLHDANGDTAGYVLPLTGDEESEASLLLTVADEVVLWQVGSMPTGLLRSSGSDGIWRLSDRLTIIPGQRVDTALQRANREATGIAFGPEVDKPGEARLFAVAFPEELLSQEATLEPERYLPELREVVGQQPPATILASIRRNQDQLSQRVDWLLRTLSPQEDRRIDLPEHIYTLQDQFDERQADLWAYIQSQEGSFKVQDVAKWGAENGFSQPELEQQLELLTLLGWLVPVNQAGKNKHRLAQGKDLLAERGE